MAQETIQRLNYVVDSFNVKSVGKLLDIIDLNFVVHSNDTVYRNSGHVELYPI